MRGRREWWALAALVLLSTGLRTWAALEVSVPWIAPDEMVYGMLGRNLWLHGSLTILGGSTPFYSLLTPLVAGFPLAVFGLDTGYDVLHGLQPFAMSLAAVPAYLWARQLVSRRGAFAAAALTLATPVLVYSGLVMTEVLFYPLLTAAAWAGAEAIARPTRRNQILLVVAILAACATRLQALVLVPALVTAVLLDAWIARSWSKLRRHLPAAVGIAVLLVAWAAWRLSIGQGALGGYEVVAGTSYSIGSAARFVLYHGASLLILCGLFPITALALKLVEALLRGEQDERVRAYLAIASSLSVWLVIQVGIFASRYSDRIVERNLIGLAPMLFIGLVLWLERGPDGGYLERTAVGLLAVAVLVLLPVDRYVNVFGTHDAMTLIPLYQLSTATSLSTLTDVYPAVAGALVLVFVLVPRRWLQWLPVALVLVLAGASVLASRFVADEARAQQQKFLGPDPSWADREVARRVAYLYDGEPSWPGVWETLFFNGSIDRVYDVSDIPVPGPLPQTRVTVRPDGKVVGIPPGLRKAKSVIASNWIEIDGEQRASVTQSSLKQAGLVLWRVKDPLRILSWTFGLVPYGDLSGPARLVAYDCTAGTFNLTLLIKEPEKIDIRVNGKLVRHLDFPTAVPSWHGDFPVQGGRGGICTLDVESTGLTGSTQFAFDRG